MSRETMGKLLLRNVIRHTDAHNKIQEETEMWKLRDMERQVPGHQASLHGKAPAVRGHMHCDRFPEKLENRGGSGARDEREARYWTRKLYEFEASIPDRWGHSGFKELYPEEFQTDGGKEYSDGERVQSRKKNCKTDLSDKRKRAKKSSRRKKRKKKEKRKAEEKRKVEEPGCEWSSGSELGGAAQKRRRKAGKGKHRKKRKDRSKERKEDSRGSDSGSGERQTDTPRRRHRDAQGDGQAGAERQTDTPRKRHRDAQGDGQAGAERRTDTPRRRHRDAQGDGQAGAERQTDTPRRRHRDAQGDGQAGAERRTDTPRKRHRDAQGDGQAGAEPLRKRKNWKATNEEKSEDSSED